MYKVRRVSRIQDRISWDKLSTGGDWAGSAVHPGLDAVKDKWRGLHPQPLATPRNEMQSMKEADHYDQSPHQPDHPEMKKSYDALIGAIGEQYNDLRGQGISFHPYQGEGEPYSDSNHMRRDLSTGKMHFLQTGKAGDLPDGHPMTQTVQTHDGPMMANDAFRAVHDALGHGYGASFGPKGEQQAWINHRATLPPEAHAALWAETRGQNVVTNYGQHMRDQSGRLLPKEQQPGLADRPFAEQKMVYAPHYALKKRVPIRIYRTKMASIYDSLIEGLSKPDGGFTIHPHTGQPNSERYLVSEPGAEQELDPASLSVNDLESHRATYQDRFDQDPSLYQGAWHDPQTKKVYLDVSKGYHDLDEAMSAGKANSQLAIYDSHEGRSIPVPNSTHRNANQDQYNMYFHDRARSWHGKGLDVLPGDGPTTQTPWPKASFVRDPATGGAAPLFDKNAVRDALQRTLSHPDPQSQLKELDPVKLYSTQPALQRGGVKHYMENGDLFSDGNNAGNQHPVVYTDKSGRNLLLSGHHRGTAALLKGEPLRAIHVTGEI